MVDLEFAEAVAAALSRALASLGDEKPLPLDDVARISRRAAWQLMFDLDGRSLMELALAKIAAEQSLAPKQAA